MSTKELIHQEVENVRPEDLDELYQLVHGFLARRNGAPPEQGVLSIPEPREPTEAEPPQNGAPKKQTLMSRLREIKIYGPEDLSENLDLYVSGEKTLVLHSDPD